MTDRLDIIMQAMPATMTQIAANTGLSRGVVRHACYALRAAGWAHVASWTRPPSHGPFQPVLRAGAGVNVECDLVRTPGTEAVRQWRARGGPKMPRRHRLGMHENPVVNRQRASPFDALMSF